MRGLYCQSDKSFLDLLRPMVAHLDSLYWIVDCQGGPVRSDWIDESDEHERIFEGLHVDVPAFESTSARLWRPGSLSQVGRVLFFDEWSYFIGFGSSEADAVERAARVYLPSLFEPDFYATLEREGELFAVHVDGWWEFYPARDDLFSQVQACAPCREIVPRPASPCGRHSLYDPAA
jgi:hypothetical protein